MDSLPKGIGDFAAASSDYGEYGEGPTWTHCRKALVTFDNLELLVVEAVLSDMDSLPKGIGDWR